MSFELSPFSIGRFLPTVLVLLSLQLFASLIFVLLPSLHLCVFLLSSRTDRNILSHMGEDQFHLGMWGIFQEQAHQSLLHLKTLDFSVDHKHVNKKNFNQVENTLLQWYQKILILLEELWNSLLACIVYTIHVEDYVLPGGEKEREFVWTTKHIYMFWEFFIEDGESECIFFTSVMTLTLWNDRRV